MNKGLHMVNNTHLILECNEHCRSKLADQCLSLLKHYMFTVGEHWEPFFYHDSTNSTVWIKWNLLQSRLEIISFTYKTANIGYVLGEHFGRSLDRRLNNINGHKTSFHRCFALNLPDLTLISPTFNVLGCMIQLNYVIGTVIKTI
jgi:hypothetical protein